MGHTSMRAWGMTRLLVGLYSWMTRLYRGSGADSLDGDERAIDREWDLSGHDVIWSEGTETTGSTAAIGNDNAPDWWRRRGSS